MLKDLETNFVALEKNILSLTKKYKDLSEQYKELFQEHNHLKEKYDEECRKTQELTEEKKRLQLMSAISGNPDHNRLMKQHINRLVKEIDACIAQLQNTGL